MTARLLAGWIALAGVVACTSGGGGATDGGAGAGMAGTGAAGTGTAGTGAAGTAAAGTGAAGTGAAGTGAAGSGAAGSGAAGTGAAGTGAAGTGAAGSGSAGAAGPSSKRQTARTLGTNGAPNGYYEYLPPGYDGSTATPLLVFWHGIGEDGNGTTDLPKVLANGPPKLVAADKWPAARPFILLSPQYVPKNGAITPGGGCPSSATVDTFLTWALTRYKVDPKRVYLTGLSCGAIGSWDYLTDHQGAVVAAAVLIAGNPGDPTQAGSAWKRAMCGLGTVAIWSLHGDKDPTVPFAPDRDTTQDLIACPAPPRRDARFTSIAGGGHGIWDPIYDLSGGSGDIYAWLLANPKP